MASDREVLIEATLFPSRREPFHNRASSSGIRLDANAIIDGSSNPLFAPKVAFGRLHRNVPQKKLDLAPTRLLMRGRAENRSVNRCSVITVLVLEFVLL
jgi:hypothetical protein